MKSRFDKGESVQHFSLRKLSIGVASVLLGTSFMLYGSKTVHADSQNNNANQNHDDTALKTTTADKYNSETAKNNYTTQSELAQKSEDSSQNNKISEQASSSVNKEQNTNVRNSQKPTKVVASDNKNTQRNSANPKNSNIDQIDQNKAVRKTYTEAQIRHAFDLDKPDLSDAQLKALGIDRDTYLENGVKYKVTGSFDAYLDNGQKFYHLPFHVTHNADGSFHNLYYDDDYTLNIPNMGVNVWGFNYAYAPLVQGGTIYIQKKHQLDFADAERGLPKEYDKGYEALVWDTKAAGYNVDINKVGTYHGAVDITYKNQLGVSTGITVVVVDPQGKTVYVTKGDPVDQPNDDVISTSIPTGSTNIVWEQRPSTSSLGPQTGTISITYPDGSQGQAKVTYIVSDPKTQDETVYPGQPLTPQEIISNPNDMPSGTKYKWTTTAPNTTVPGTTVPAEVTVTYPDGHNHVVSGNITVISANGKPATTVNVNEPLPDASTIITNTGSMPKGTTYTWETQPSTAQPGQFPATVIVKYPSGVIQKVPTTVIVVGNNTPATITVKDNSKVVTRVIVDNVPGQAAIITWQNVHYSRDVTYNTKTGQIVSTSDWQATDTPTWAQYTAKGAAGYTPSIAVVAAENVTADTPNTVVSITYTENGQPTNPSQPTSPSSPTQPTNSSQPTNNPPKPENPTNPTNPTNPAQPTNNPPKPENPTNPTNPAQPTNNPPKPENPANPTNPAQPTNNPPKPKNPANPGNSDHTGQSSNVRPHAVTPANPDNAARSNNPNGLAQSNNVKPHAASAAESNQLASNNAPKAQSALPQTGESDKDEAMAAVGTLIAVGSGLFVLIGADKRHKIN